MADHAGRAVFAQPFPDERGNRQVGLVVEVYLRGTLTPATLYSDAEKTGGPIAGNSFATDGMGNAFPYLDPGDYDAHVQGQVLPFSVLADPRDTADTAQLDAAVAGEADARAAADTTEAGARLAADNAEAAARLLADVALQDAVDTEVVARQVAVQGETSARIAAVQGEANTRATAVADEAAARTAADNAEAAARAADVQAEEDARVAASIAETLARQTAIAAEATARTDAIAVEANARAAGDADLAADVADLAAADVVLQTNINARQPGNANLSAIAALTTTAWGRGLLELATAALARATLGLGTAATQDSTAFDPAGAAAAVAAGAQPLDPDLTALAQVATTVYGRGLLALADALAARNNLGLGTMATQAANAVAITGGTVAGINDLAVADGGTGASSPAAARTNLGLGSAATAAATDFATPADVAAEASARTTADAGKVSTTGGGKEVVSTIATGGAAATLDLAVANVFVVNNPAAGGTCVLTLAGATAGRSCGGTVYFHQRASGDSTLAFAGGTILHMNDGDLPGPAQVPDAVAVYGWATVDGGATVYVWKVGDSAQSSPPEAPDAPVIGVATPGNGQASVAFTPGASNGAVITGYTVTSSPGGITATGGASPIVVAGLTNGTAYTFTVHATNVMGNSPESGASAAVTPATVPGAPTIGTATPGNTTATINWTAPASNGGSAITGYVAKLYRASDNVEIASATPGNVTTYQFTALTNGTAVYGKVAATNAVGTGAQSAASATVTPAAGPSVPSAPTIGTATAANTTATANWTAPGSNGGSAITGYEVKTYDSAGTLLATDAVGVVLTFTKTGLTNGTAVKFKVAAVNAIGTGAQSAFSNTVTPVAPGFADNFNRADGALGTSSSGHAWASSGMTITSNKARRTSGAGGADIDSGLADFSLEVVVVNGGSPEIGLIVRKTDANNYWYCAVAGDNLYFLKYEAGVLANITSAIVVGSNTGTHTFKVTGIGNDLKFYVDGTLALSMTHAFNATATRHGIGGGNVFATDTASTYDDVVCTTP